MQTEYDYQRIYTELTELMAEEFGFEPEELLPEVQLEEDLDIPVEESNQLFRRLLRLINGHFDINLDPELMTEEEEEQQTLGYLVELIQDEVEL